MRSRQCQKEALALEFNGHGAPFIQKDRTAMGLPRCVIGWKVITGWVSRYCPDRIGTDGLKDKSLESHARSFALSSFGDGLANRAVGGFT
jgi:hypothetical protein